MGGSEKALQINTPGNVTINANPINNGADILIGNITPANTINFGGAIPTTIDTGGGSILLKANPLSLTRNINTNGGNITLGGSSITTNEITLNSSSANQGGIISLESTGNITTGLLTFGATNPLGIDNSLQINTSGIVNLNDAINNNGADLIIGKITAPSQINLNGVSEVNTAGGNLFLNSSGVLSIAKPVSSNGGSITLIGTSVDTSTITLDATKAGFTGGAIDITATNGWITAGGIIGDSLTTTGKIQLGGNVTTTNPQTYNSAVQINGTNTILTTTNNPITFNSTVDGQTSGTNSLSLNSGNGDVTFKNNIGATQSLGNLTVNSGGTTDFGGTVNAQSLTTDVGGTTKIQNNVTTNNGQNYGDAVTLTNSSTTLTTTNNPITFNSTVDGQSSGSNSLTLNSGIGDVTFKNNLGATQSLGNLIVNSGGATNFQGTVNSQSLTTDVGGTTKIQNNVTTNNGQNYGDAVTLTNSSTTLTTTNNPITFNSTVDGQSSGSNSLTLNSGIGDVTFKNNLGATQSLGNLTVNSGGTTDFGGTVNAQSLTTDVGGITKIQNNVTTNNGQSYGDAVTLTNSSTILTTTNNPITFNSTVDGQSSGTNSLTLNSGSGDVTFKNNIGATQSLGNLTVNSGGTTDFGGTVNAQSLTTDVGGITKIQNNVTTNNGQSYGDAVTLTNSSTILTTTNNPITFNSTVDGQSSGTNSLTLNSGSGDVTFKNNIGATQSLGNLTVNSGGTTDFGGTVNAQSLTTDVGGITKIQNNVTTNNGQSYGDAVTLTNSSTILTTTNNPITFNSTVDGQSSGTNSLTLTSGNGDVTFKNNIGATQSLGNLTVNSGGITDFGGTVNAQSLTTDVGGTTKIQSNVTTNNGQSYGDAVTLTNSSTILTTTNNPITFNNTLDGQSSGTNSLTLNSGSGDVTFKNNIGATQSLGNLTVNSGGTTSFQGTVNAQSLTTDVGGTTKIQNNVTTNNGQSYGDAVTLTNSSTLTTTNNPITFNSTVDGQSSGTNSLTLNSGSGDVTFKNNIGATQSLGNLTVNSGGTTDFGGTVNAQSLATDVGGITKIQNNVTTNNGQSYGDAVTLTNSSTTFTNNIGAINFNNTLDGQTSGTNSLTLNSGSGDITFKNNIGATQSLGNLTVNSGGTTSFQGTVNAQSLTTDVGGTTKIQNNVTTNNGQSYGDAVTLTNSSTLTTTNNPITFNSTVDGQSSGTNSLTLNSGNGDVTFKNNIGATQSLGNLTVNSGGTTDFGGTVNAQSLTTYVGGITKIQSNVTTNNGQSYGDAVTLTNSSTTLTTTNNPITFNSTVDGQSSGTNSLTLNSGSGDVTFKNNIGATQSLGNLAVNSGGTTDFGGTVNAQSLTTDVGGITKIQNNVTTNNGQSYGDAVTLTNSSTTLTTTNNPITFNNTLDGQTSGTNSLTLNSGSGDVTFKNNIGATQSLGNLTVNSGGTTDFGGTVNAQSLTTDVGGITKIQSNVTTNNGQSYGDAVTLTNSSTTLTTTNNPITFNSTVDGQSSGTNSLTLNSGSGDVTFKNNIGATKSLGNLIVNSEGITNFGGTVNAQSLTIDVGGITKIQNNVTTNNGQSYGDALTLTNSSTTLTNNNGAINFNNTLDGQTSGTNSLIINTDNLVFSNQIGVNQAFKDISIQTQQALNLNNSIQTDKGNVTITSPGITTNNITTNGGNISLNSSGGLSIAKPISTAGGSITLSGTNVDTSTIDAGVTGGAIDITATNGEIIAGDIIGNSLTTTGKIQLNGNVTTTNTQIYNNAVQLNANNSILATTNNPITFNSTVDGQTPGSNSLTLNSSNGDVTFKNNIGATQSLGNLTVNSRGTTSFQGTVNAQSLTTDVGGITKIENNVTTSNGQSYGDAVTLTNSSTTFTNNNGGINFNSTVDGQSSGSNSLVINTDNLVLGNQVGENQGFKDITIQTQQALNLNHSIQTVQGNVTITSPGITTNNITTNGGNISLNSSNQVNTSSGNLTTTSSRGNSGNINIFAPNELIIGNVNTSNSNQTAGTINLTSQNASIISGDLNAAGNTQGGEIKLIAQTSVTTGKINSNASNGNAGNVNIDPIGDVAVGYINAQGGINGSGGNIDITAGRYFRASDTFIDQNGLIASISTVGNLANGSFTLRHFGGYSGVPFDIGNPVINGTAGEITTSLGNRLTLGQSFPYLYFQGPGNAIRLITASAPVDPTPKITSRFPEETQPQPPSQISIPNTLEDADIDLGMEKIDSSFGNKFKDYFDLPFALPRISLDQSKEILTNIEKGTGAKPALIYVTFVPDLTIQNQPASSSVRDSDKLEILVVTAKGKPIRKVIYDVTRAKILDTAKEFRKTVTNKNSQAYLASSHKIYNWLIKPLQTELQQRQINNLLFIMDEGLGIASQLLHSTMVNNSW